MQEDILQLRGSIYSLRYCEKTNRQKLFFELKKIRNSRKQRNIFDHISVITISMDVKQHF